MLNKLKQVLQIQSASYNQYRMFAYLIRQAKKLNCSYYVDNGNIYITKGVANTYPCIVAHMDTVHDITSDLTILEVKGNLMGYNALTMQPTGIGGDDKVGIFIALQCLEKFEVIKVAFFRDEEIGCGGSYEGDFTFFENCGYVLQCDRKGYGDFVTVAGGVNLSSKSFQNAVRSTIKKYRYKICVNGGMTDVMALREIGVGCSMANISCGYYRPHCEDEYVSIANVTLCMHMVFEIVGNLQGSSYPCEHEKKSYSKYSTKLWDSKFDNLTSSVNVWGDNMKAKQCDYCMDIAHTEYCHEYHMELCKKCAKDWQVDSYAAKY